MGTKKKKKRRRRGNAFTNYKKDTPRLAQNAIQMVFAPPQRLANRRLMRRNGCIVTIPKSPNAERIKEVTHSLALVYIHCEYCMSIHNTLLAHSIGWLAGWLFLPSFLSY
jgi:hypothetical protein